MLLACRVIGFTSAYTRSISACTFLNVRQNDHAAGARKIASPSSVSVMTPLAIPVTVSNHPRSTATVFMITVSGSVACWSSHAPERVMISVIISSVCKGKASGHGHAMSA